jgi:hypothetical protein
MATIQSPVQRCNAVLRAFGARYRLREHRRSPWITVYQLGKGGTTREHTVKGYVAADPEAIERLQDLLIEATRSGKPAVLPGGQKDLVSTDTSAPLLGLEAFSKGFRAAFQVPGTQPSLAGLIATRRHQRWIAGFLEESVTA